jgi:hypothetical protein
MSKQETKMKSSHSPSNTNNKTKQNNGQTNEQTNKTKQTKQNKQTNNQPIHSTHTELWVCLVDPSPWRDAIRHIAELMREHLQVRKRGSVQQGLQHQIDRYLIELREEILHDQLRVQLGHTVDAIRANHSQVRHADLARRA